MSSRIQLTQSPTTVAVSPDGRTALVSVLDAEQVVELALTAKR